MSKNILEIENINVNIDNEIGFLRKFHIYDDSKLFQSRILNIITSEEIIGEIKNSEIHTGIMISNIKINNILIYLFILDNRIFIIKQINLPQFQEFFSGHLDSLMFMTKECKDDFFKDISSKFQISEQNHQILNEQNDVKMAIKDEIIQCTIKKSQYRTIKMRQNLLPNIFNSKNDSYHIDDFILIHFQGFRLYYNSKDQILNVLKFYNNENWFKHEIGFYHQIENTFPFIRKIFGIIKRSNELPIIILEYVEGETLNNFILSEKEISFNTKIKIIVEIMFSVNYVHSNGFYLRDLKPDNIIIDSNNDAILIDFDSSKELNSPNEEETTGNIGDPVYTAPEQLFSNDYTYLVDSYSVGMIFHFIITRHKFNFSHADLLQIYEKKENISKNNKFPKCPKEYEFVLNIYEKCFESSPCSRPFIISLIENIIFINNNIQLKRFSETELPHIFNQLEQYESIFENGDNFLNFILGLNYYSGKYITKNINKAIIHLEKALNHNAQFYLGEIYYLGQYISRDINKSIHYFTLSANQNNPNSQFYLGEIYYLGKYISRDINKSIHHLTLSANQNDPDAQYLLGIIYYENKYISRDINKSIHYFTLSANQNHPVAQYLLGIIYYTDQYISRDINKSIHYFTLSANQNHSNAQFFLGKIYYLGEFISRNINKSIQYLTLSFKNF